MQWQIVFLASVVIITNTSIAIAFVRARREDREIIEHVGKKQNEMLVRVNKLEKMEKRTLQ